MAHEIYRVMTFEKVAPFTLRVLFDDGVSQLIDFRSVPKGELYGPLQDPSLSTRSRSIRRFIRWSGQTAQTLIPRFFTTGPSQVLHSRLWRKSGYLRTRARQEHD